MKLTRRNFLNLCMATSAVVLAGAEANAVSWPAKPISMVVAYPAGGDTDALARMIAEKLSIRLKQTVVVDNRPGASGTVGGAYVARAAPDGYTLLLAPSTFAIAPLVLSGGINPSHDVVKDFTPVILIANSPNLIVAYPGTGLRGIRQLVAEARAGKAFSYASPGSGSPMHIAAEIFNKSAGIQMTHVPYKGIAPAVNDLLGGHVDIAFVTPGAVEGHLAKGKLTPLAITDAQRSPVLPNVPTLAELGYKEVAVSSWWGVLGPKGLPPEIVRTLNTQIIEVLRMPDVIARMAALGMLPGGGDPATLARAVAGDNERFGKAVKEFNIRAE